MRAILSVSDKSGLATSPAACRSGVELVSTGGTAKAIAAAGLPVINVSDVTGFPEMMDGRVKTLHPAIFAGILARRHRPDDLAAIASPRHHADRPRRRQPVSVRQGGREPGHAVRRPGRGDRHRRPQPAARRRPRTSATSSWSSHPEDYPRVLEELARDGGPSLEFRFELMKKAFMHTGQYDGMIAMTMAHVEPAGGAMTRRPRSGPRPRLMARPRDAAIRREPASEGGVDRLRPDAGRAWTGASGQGAVLHEPARSRRRAAHRARVHRARARS